MKILNVVGARPNFMKIAPLMAEYKRHENIHAILVHTGQHYDDIMSNLFFSELDIPKPDIKQSGCGLRQPCRTDRRGHEEF